MTIPNGHFTVTSPKAGNEHRTFRVRTVLKGELQGSRTMGLLTGPDNNSSYNDFGFVIDDQGDNDFVIMWKRFRIGNGAGIVDGYRWSGVWGQYQKMAAILTDLVMRGEAGFWYSHGYRVLIEKRCVRCNRRLTTPESIAAGIGPECGKREGV